MHTLYPTRKLCDLFEAEEERTEAVEALLSRHSVSAG